MKPFSYASIARFCRSQGWDLFGVVSYSHLQPFLTRHLAVFERWIAQGYHGNMDYLSRMKQDRYDPKNRFPEFDSAIVLGAWYSDDKLYGSAAGRRFYGRKIGVVAQYATGKDYHKVLRKRCQQLVRWLKEARRGGSLQNPFQAFISVDSGPTADRVLAEAAGLGFFGQNTLMINPEKGSFFFIASILTNWAIEETPRQVMPDCGSCRRCIDVCPTGALLGNGQIDARRCISYLTIENKEGIPPELRPKIGNRIFGCDICQVVCPFNRKNAPQQEVLIEELKGKYGAGDTLDLTEILALETDAQFCQKFAGTPLMRAKRRGLLRNACVVAGNSGDQKLIPLLSRVREREQDPMIKEHVLWAIERLKNA